MFAHVHPVLEAELVGNTTPRALAKAHFDHNLRKKTFYQVEISLFFGAEKEMT